MVIKQHDYCLTPLQWLFEVAEYWQDLEDTVNSDPEHHKHDQLLTCLMRMQAMHELCTDSCKMGLCIIMLLHEVMEADGWSDSGPQDIIAVSLCIQIAIIKMHLFLLSVTHACPCHNPTAPMGTLFTTLANNSPTQCHTR